MLTQLLLTARAWMGPNQSVVIRERLDAVSRLLSGLTRLTLWRAPR
jgi:hypothetical protein